MAADNRRITIAAVAREAGVSPDFLYHHPALRERLMDLGRKHSGTGPAVQDIHRGDDTNIVLILKQRLSAERAARIEAERLLAVAHGELIALKRQPAQGAP